jgi:hypothetical protein
MENNKKIECQGCEEYTDDLKIAKMKSDVNVEGYFWLCKKCRKKQLK